MQKDVSKDKRFLEIRKLFEELERDYNLDKNEILGISDEIVVPVSVFDSHLSGFEAIVKFLVEEMNLSLKQITTLTTRSKQGVWQAYNRSKKKHNGKLKLNTDGINFPLSIIYHSKFSVLESIVKYLKDDTGKTFAEISRLLHRDQRTIWTVYNRAKGK